MKKKIQETEEKEKEVIRQRDAKVVAIGNLVHDSVPVSQDEVRLCSRPGGQVQPWGWLYTHSSSCPPVTYATGRGLADRNRGSVGMIHRDVQCFHLNSDSQPHCRLNSRTCSHPASSSAPNRITCRCCVCGAYPSPHAPYPTPLPDAVHEFPEYPTPRAPQPAPAPCALNPHPVPAGEQRDRQDVRRAAHPVRRGEALQSRGPGAAAGHRQHGGGRGGEQALCIKGGTW